MDRVRFDSSTSVGDTMGGAVPPQGGVSQEGGGVVMDLLEVVLCEAEAS